MHRTQFLCAIGVTLLSAVVSGSQSAPATLSEALRAHLKGEQFDVVTSLRGLPLDVRSGLQTLFRSQTLDIAEPGAEYQATDVMVKPGLSFRRLVKAGCSKDFHCLVYYERGGIAHTWQVALFHWTPDATRFEGGGVAPGGLATIEAVRNALVSGAVKGSPGSW